jgi:hypothetical protein
VQYLNEAELGALLAKGIRHRGVGVLQKFVVPADKRCTTVCATWSPQVGWLGLTAHVHVRVATTCPACAS